MSNMDTIDKLVRQIVAKGNDISPVEEGIAAAQSVAQSQPTINFPEQKVGLFLTHNYALI